MKKTTWFAGRFPGYVSPLSGVALSVLAALCPLTSRGESYFNPAFLSADTASVADLSRFEKGNHQPPGIYRVDIWRNDEFVATQDIRFEAGAVGAGDKSGGLMPCFTPEWIKRLGVNTAAFPVSDKGVDTTCIHLPEKIPGAEVAFDFASMRLNTACRRRHCSTARVAISRRKSGMKGYPPHSSITVLPVAAEQTAIAIF